MKTPIHDPNWRLPSLFKGTSRHLFLLSCVLIAIGFALMAGPGSTSEAFRPDIFSARRIVVAPAVCLAGYLLVAVSILADHKGDDL